MSMRSYYQQQLAALDDDLQALGRRVMAQVQDALDALNGSDTALASAVIAGDERINAEQDMIGMRALDIIATQQPVATDLRRLLATMDIASELERIGDYAKGVAKVIVQDAPPAEALAATALPQLAEQANAMLMDVLEALARHDGDIARRLEEADDRVDALHERVRSELIAVVQYDPATAPWALDCRKVAYLLERIADRATNIGEQIIFMLRGETVELNH
jgi:phosphate transport system protein